MRSAATGTDMEGARDPTAVQAANLHQMQAQTMAWALVQAAQVKGNQNPEAIIVMTDITGTHRQGPMTDIRTEARAADIRNLDPETGMGMTGGTGTEAMVIGQPAAMAAADLGTAASIQAREVDMGMGEEADMGVDEVALRGVVVVVDGVRCPGRPLIWLLFFHAIVPVLPGMPAWRILLHAHSPYTVHHTLALSGKCYPCMSVLASCQFFG